MENTFYNSKSIDRLNEIMKENHTEKGKPLKAADLSRITGVSQKHLSNILTDNKPLTPQTALKIIKGFPNRRYRVEWLMGEDDLKTEGAAFDFLWEQMGESSRQRTNAYKLMASIMQKYGVEWNGDCTAYLQADKKGDIIYEGCEGRVKCKYVPGTNVTIKYKEAEFETWELAAIVDEVIDFLQFRLDHAADTKRKEKADNICDRQPVSIAFKK